MMGNTFWKDWELVTDKGRQQWRFKKAAPLDKEYLNNAFTAFEFDKNTNPNSADSVFRSWKLENENIGERKSDSAFDALQQGMKFYSLLQVEDGNWTGDYGGPLFLLPGLITASVVTNSPLPEIHQKLIARYIFNQQNTDGGWGLHIEGKSTVFGTVMNYVALRFLGYDLQYEKMQRAQHWIKEAGGATSIPSWGKFYLSLLNLYDWRGNNSLMPELWILPKWLPIHPSRYWCHSRLVYLPMSYCFGHKIQITDNDLVKQIRKEIYVQPYSDINWQKARDEVNERDVYYKATPLLSVVNFISNTYEQKPKKSWRKKALDFIQQYIDAEDEQTSYINIGPVNQVINSIAVWHHHGKDSRQFQQHYERWFDYLWLAEDGMKMNGYNGSQLWDTAFAVQAFCEADNASEFYHPIKKAYDYIDYSQIKEDGRGYDTFFRHRSVGGWPFSTIDHSFPITDCTAEGITASLAVHKTFPQMAQQVNFERMGLAVDLILSLQNKDGGWASYELTRAPKWIERINPSSVFADIMTDYSYTECSSSCIQALHHFHTTYPDYKSEQIEKSLEKGIKFIQKQQRTDGSWFGSWAVCFTYATWFGLEALATQDKFYDNSSEVKSACDFLLSKQREDGGWGESFESCVKKEYIQHEHSQAVNTAWAILGLMAAKYPNQQVIDRAIKQLIKLQDKNGDWAQQAISGVFNFNCMITYTSYRNVFPIWALARYARNTTNK